MSPNRKVHLFSFKAASAALVLSQFLTTPVFSQTNQNISGSVPIYCLDSTGNYQPMQRTNYSKLQKAFVTQFGFKHSLQSTGDSTGELNFSSSGKHSAAERFFYDVRPYDDGIALLHMHVRLKGVSDDLSGTEMCWRTFSIVNGN